MARADSSGLLNLQNLLVGKILNKSINKYMVRESSKVRSEKNWP
jgi:hypothetical protein